MALEQTQIFDYGNDVFWVKETELALHMNLKSKPEHRHPSENPERKTIYKIHVDVVQLIRYNM